MWRFSVGFGAGCLLVQHLRLLPDPLWSQWLLLPVLVALVAPRVRIQSAFLFGVLWASLHAHTDLAELRQAWRFTGDHLVEGCVTSLVRSNAGHQAFTFRVGRVTRPDNSVDANFSVGLRWYGREETVAPGVCRRLEVRMKPVRAYFNPGGRDRALGWMRRGVHATGYVRGDAPPANHAPESVAVAARTWLAAGRSWIDDHLGSALSDVPRGQLIRALVLGVRDGISSDEREVMFLTGTAHLLAISGLHIGLAAGGVHTLVLFAWRRTGRFQVWFTAPAVAAFAAAFAAFAYALLSGFGIPAQRALIMLCVWLAGTLVRARLQPAELLSLTAVAVLLYDPAAVVDAGFWLSFGAVGALTIALQGTGGSPAVSLIRAQYAATVGLAPLTLMWFGAIPVLGWLANLVAVPLVGVLVVPAALCGTLLSVGLPTLGALPLQLAGHALDWLWLLLGWLAEPRFLIESATAINPVSLGLGALGSLLMLTRLPGRWAASLLWLPALAGSYIVPDSRVPPGEFEVTVFDVGQGLAVGVRTAARVLLYDTGPGGRHWSVAYGTVIPAMSTAGVRHIDLLMVSHPDQDHAGGTGAVVRALRPRRRLGDAGTYAAGTGAPFAPCVKGQRWTWDGVKFEVLYPGAGEGGSRNDRSCVLKVTGEQATLLLPGDIEGLAEERLLTRGTKLHADILVAPHHGSRSSSSHGFVTAVRPKVVIFSAGWMNRFGQPHAPVVRRFGRMGASLYNTATDGAIRIRSGPGAISVETSMPALERYWHAPRAGGG